MKTMKLFKGITFGLLMTWAMGAQAQWVSATGGVSEYTGGNTVTIDDASPEINLEISNANVLSLKGTSSVGAELESWSPYALRLDANGGNGIEFETNNLVRATIGTDGVLDLTRAGTVLSVGGDQALWSNDDYYSWGFGKDYSYWANELIIGQSGLVPNETDGLTIGSSEDLRFEGPGGKFVRFTESGVQKGLMGHNGTDMFLRNTETGGDVYIGASSTNDLVIETSGEVGINTSSPEAMLHVADGTGSFTGTHNSLVKQILESDNQTFFEINGVSWSGFSFADTEGSLRAGTFYNHGDNYLQFKTGGVDSRVVITENGNVSIGAGTSPTYKLEIDGNVDITGELTSSSDMRLKRDIEPLENALDVVKKLNPVSYNFKTDVYTDMELAQRHKMGLLAQEVEAILPALVSEGSEATDENGDSFNVKSVNYVEMIPLLIKSIQELQDENEALKQRLEKLETK